MNDINPVPLQKKFFFRLESRLSLHSVSLGQKYVRTWIRASNPDFGLKRFIKATYAKRTLGRSRA